jgi:hypothetical protein
MCGYSAALTALHDLAREMLKENRAFLLAGVG